MKEGLKDGILGRTDVALRLAMMGVIVPEPGVNAAAIVES